GRVGHQQPELPVFEFYGQGALFSEVLDRDRREQFRVYLADIRIDDRNAELFRQSLDDMAFVYQVHFDEYLANPFRPRAAVPLGIKGQADVSLGDQAPGDEDLPCSNLAALAP